MSSTMFHVKCAAWVVEIMCIDIGDPLVVMSVIVVAMPVLVMRRCFGMANDN